MPLVNCPDCGNDISPSAPNCPHCGSPKSTVTPKKKETSPLLVLIVAVSLSFGVATLTNKLRPSSAPVSSAPSVSTTQPETAKAGSESIPLPPDTKTCDGPLYAWVGGPTGADNPVCQNDIASARAALRREFSLAMR